MSEANGCPDPNCNDETCGPNEGLPFAIPLPIRTDDFLIHMAAGVKFGPLYSAIPYDHPDAEKVRDSVAPAVGGVMAALTMLGYDVPDPEKTITPDDLQGEHIIASSLEEALDIATGNAPKDTPNENVEWVQP